MNNRQSGWSESARETALRSCRYCPMCHHADLVTTLERRETYSPRGRGLILFAIEQGKTTWNPDVADVMYRFFADGLSRHVCAGHIPHDDLIIDARQKLVAAGAAPSVVSQVKSNIERTGNPWAETEPALSALTGARARSEVLVYFGPTARIKRPSAITALTTVLRKAEVEYSILPSEGDPGLLLYELGHPEAAISAAGTLARKITDSGARTVVTPDAEAYRTLKSGFGGVSPLQDIKVHHASEFLLGLAARLKLHEPTAQKIAYHDPCTLARFAPCLEAPRQLLQRITQSAPLEIGAWHRELTQCSGECGGVPFTHPGLSNDAAERRVQEAKAAGAERIVTGSPAAANVLQGRGLPVCDLSEFVAEFLA
jgi:Fe-S oxidoreductase